MTVLRVCRIPFAAGRRRGRRRTTSRRSRTAGSDRRWPAAYELSRLMDDPKVRADRALGARRWSRPFDDAKDGDPRVRRYLALAIGRLEPPLPPEAVAALCTSLDDPEPAGRRTCGPGSTAGRREINEAHISTIWALGASGDPAVVPRLQPLYDSPDAGIRKMVVYALGRAARATRR